MRWMVFLLFLAFRTDLCFRAFLNIGVEMSLFSSILHPFVVYSLSFFDIAIKSSTYLIQIVIPNLSMISLSRRFNNLVQVVYSLAISVGEPSSILTIVVSLPRRRGCETIIC